MPIAEMEKKAVAAESGEGLGAGKVVLTEQQMKLGSKCAKCPFCSYARRKPESLTGKVLNWHGKKCPAWQSYIQMEKAGLNG